MTPVKKKPYRGPDRRAPKPPPDPRATRVGLVLVLSGFGAWVLFHLLQVNVGELVPMAMITIGGIIMDKDVLKAPKALLPWKRNGDTAEYEARR